LYDLVLSFISSERTDLKTVRSGVRKTFKPQSYVFFYRNPNFYGKCSLNISCSFLRGFSVDADFPYLSSLVFRNVRSWFCFKNKDDFPFLYFCPVLLQIRYVQRKEERTVSVKNSRKKFG